MKKLGISIAVLLVLIVSVALVLPRLIDANRYRGFVESRAEKALGRDVRLGEMSLSLFPTLGLKVADVALGALPEEGGGDLLTARSLRVGARFGPLLRKRLEITSLVLEGPTMVLARDRDGRWNVERLVARDESTADAPADGGDGELSIDRLRIRDGQLVYRDASLAAGEPFEVVLDGLELALDGLGSVSGRVSFELSTSVGSAPGARLALAGDGGPLAGDGREPPELHADLELEHMTGDLVTRLATAAGWRLDGVFGDRPLDASARLDLAGGSLALSRVRVAGADVELRRDRGGRWNVVPPERAAGAEPETVSFAVRDVELDGLRLRLRDASLGPEPLDVTFDGLRAELDRWPLAEPAAFRLTAGVAGGGALEVSGNAGPGRGRPAADGGLDLAVDVRCQDLPGNLLTGLAAAGGTGLDGVFGDRPIDVQARVEVAGGRTTVHRLEVSGADVDLRRGRDARWNFTLPDRGAPSRPAVAVRNLVLDGVRLRLRDETVGVRPLDAVLDGLRLELDRLPSEGPAAFRLASRIAAPGGDGELEVSGQAGPTAPGGELPLRLTARVGALPLAAVQPMLEMLAGEGQDAGRADLELEVEGTFPAQLEARGTARVAGAKVRVGESGKERLLDLDLGARFDAGVRRGGELFEIRALDVDLAGSTLALRGTVGREGEALRWDMSLAPSRLPADELRALLALFVDDMAVTFSAEEPIAIEARVQGSTAEGEAVDVSGRVAVEDLRLAHPALTLPLERVRAEASFRGERVEIRGLSASVGTNDLTGEMTVDGFAAPRLAFDLRAERADLGQLLSLAAEDDGAAGSETQSGVLATVFAEGDLRAAAGSWDTLQFTDLDAHLRLENGVATLEPATMQLYGGTFRGRVVADLTVEPTTFDIRGDAEKIDVDPFLASNLSLGNLLFGRFTGEVEARGAGDDYDAILKSLTGGGRARVEEGRLGRTDVLGAVAKVAGVLGQRTLANLADRLATHSTRFERLEGRFRLAEGKMRFEELLLDSPDFALRGQGLADLLSQALDGQFRIAFSSELSELMRLEGSRAAEVFWDPQSGKVAMPLALKGSLAAPAASVDWSSAVEGYAKRRAAEGLLDLLGKALGDKDRPPPEPASAPPASVPPASAPLASAPPADTAGGELEAEITGVRWGGSLLFQDLKLTGVVRGRGLERASLEAVDAGGRVVKRWDRLPDVDAQLAGGDPSAWAEAGWQARIDGKELALARFPLTLRLTVHGRGGDRVEAARVIEK